MKKRLMLFLICGCAAAAQGVISAGADKSFVVKRQEEQLRANPKDQIEANRRLRDQKRAEAEREAEVMRKLDPYTVRALVSGKLTRQEIMDGARATPEPVKEPLKGKSDVEPVSPLRRALTYGIVLGILAVALVLNVMKKRKGGE